MSQGAGFDPVAIVSSELAIAAAQVAGVVSLLGEGNTVPFIARYRKEVTGSLDEVAIRDIAERVTYLAELQQRREVVLASIAEQGQLTAELRGRILACVTKAELEDLYLPFKPRRRTRAQIARERGLEPLALRITQQPAQGDPLVEAAEFVDAKREVVDAEAALAGARDIVAEGVAEQADVRALLRDRFRTTGVLTSRIARGKGGVVTKFDDYRDYREPVARIPSHRYLAVRRGEREQVLKVAVVIEEAPLVERVIYLAGLAPTSPFAEQLRLAVADACTRLAFPAIESELRSDLKERAERDAVDVFAANLSNLLLVAPLGQKPVIGVDPGLRTGCKCAALDTTGGYLGTVTFNLVAGDHALIQGRRDLGEFVRRHGPFAIAVGNGTGGREAEDFVRQTLAGIDGVDPIVVTVSEAGASVYSASPLAGAELPDLDVTIRGAVSIARRLQDPLAELVKIDPKAIGVGQYQHDVHQPLLARKLEDVVESCVNAVGVELNTASAPLLSRVAGIGPRLARNVVDHRGANGPFRSRKRLLDVKGLGPRTFEQAAGFLRLAGSEHPLDGSAVHPERYGLVERIAADLGVGLGDLVGNSAAAGRIDISRYLGDGVGEPTLRDIVSELGKPGRDPRAEFEPPAFRDDVRSIDDLREGMDLSGVVTNVTDFGAFVDVGVHRDGLVHVSQLADHFVRNPAEVVKVGDRLRVRVVGVDLERGRISLSARKGERPQGERTQGERPQKPARPEPRCEFVNNPFADLLKK